MKYKYPLLIFYRQALEKLVSLFVLLAMGFIISMVIFLFEKMIPTRKSSNDQSIEEAREKVQYLRFTLTENHKIYDSEVLGILNQIEYDVMNVITKMK